MKSYHRYAGWLLMPLLALSIHEIWSEQSVRPTETDSRNLQTTTPGRAEEAPALEDCRLDAPEDVLRCVQKNDPDVREARAELLQFSSAVHTAEQRPNPELEGGADLGSPRAYNLEYRHIIEPGNRRELRTDVARSREREAALRVELSLQNAVMRTAIALYRLKQLEEEETFLREARGAFNAAIYRLYRLPARSADQQASLFSYVLARNSIEQQRIRMETERQAIRGDLERWTGARISDGTLKRIVAEHPESWPTMPESYSDSVELALAEEGVSRSASDLRLQESKAWPDLGIGPRFSYRRQESSVLDSGSSKGRWNAGISFSLTLPLYNQYEGQEEEARARKKSREIQRQTTKISLESEYRSLARSYRVLVKGFQSHASPESMAGQRYAILGYLRRGLVSPPMLIEYHRTYADYLHQYHTTQLQALRLLWRGYALTGRILDDEIIESIQ